MVACFLLLSALLLTTAAAASHGVTQVDVAKQLKEKLWERNQGHEMLKSWNGGDPCFPSTWEGFSCPSKEGNHVVVKLNFSSKKLQRPIPAATGNLTELNELDLQDNNFTGSIPDSFSALTRLLKLSVKCNPFLSNQLPDGLSTGMDFSYGGCTAEEYYSPPAEEYHSPPGVANQKIFVVGGAAGGSLACTFALGSFIVCFNKRELRPQKTDCSSTTNPVFEECSIHKTTNPSVQQLSLKSIQSATCNFKTLIGEGGFGAVYLGTLAHGQEVAIKVRSTSSTQGTREFNNEAKQYIREYRIEEIVDPGIKGQYCSEAMWRVIEVASVCTELFSTFRPSMEDVVRELEDALIIENNASEYMRSIKSTETLGSNRYLSIDRKMFASGSARIDATKGHLQTMPSLPR